MLWTILLLTILVVAKAHILQNGGVESIHCEMDALTMDALTRDYVGRYRDGDLSLNF